MRRCAVGMVTILQVGLLYAPIEPDPFWVRFFPPGFFGRNIQLPAPSNFSSPHRPAPSAPTAEVVREAEQEREQKAFNPRLFNPFLRYIWSTPSVANAASWWLWRNKRWYGFDPQNIRLTADYDPYIPFDSVDRFALLKRQERWKAAVDVSLFVARGLPFLGAGICAGLASDWIGGKGLTGLFCWVSAVKSLQLSPFLSLFQVGCLALAHSLPRLEYGAFLGLGYGSFLYGFYAATNQAKLPPNAFECNGTRIFMPGLIRDLKKDIVISVSSKDLFIEVHPGQPEYGTAFEMDSE